MAAAAQRRENECNAFMSLDPADRTARDQGAS
jgi:hypothetical protein